MSRPFSHRQRPTPRGPRQWRRACEHGSSPVGAPAWVSKSTQQVLPGTGRDAPAPPGRSGPHRLPHSLPAAPLQALPFWYPGGRGLGSRGWGRLLARGRPGRRAGGHTDGRGEGAGGRRSPREGQVSPPPDQGQPTPAAAPALPETTVHPRRWASGHSPVQQPPQRQLPPATPAPAAANKSFCTPTCGWTPGPCAGRAGRLGPHPSRDPACHRPGSPLASPQGLGV